MKAAVYCGTRNLYGDMVTALKSLLLHSDVERVFFLIEDDVFPHPLPDCVECINVSGQTFFPPGGPNYTQKWTWMVLMRTALAKVLPQELDTVLSLDVDTIVDQDISELWDVPIGDNYIAAAREPFKSGGGYLYCNVGVMLVNLKKLRADRKDDEIIAELNRRHYDFPDQDVMNDKCQGRILKISGDYNACPWVEPYRTAKVIHFAANDHWQGEALVERYRAIPWEAIRCAT